MISYNAMPVVISLFSVLIAAFIGWCLYLGIIKEKQREKEKEAIEKMGLVSLKRLKKYTQSLIKNKGFHEHVAMILIDIDQFTALLMKHPDDSENILAQVSMRISSQLPLFSQMAREDLDMFIITLFGMFDLENIQGLGQEILQQFKEPFILNNGELCSITASVSVVYFPQHGIDYNTLYQSLRITNEYAKYKGGNRLNLYKQPLLQDFEASYKQHEQVRRALQNKEFQFFYQPIIRLEAKDTRFGYELRLRWFHQDLGVLTPQKFFQVIEQSGDIHELGYLGFKTMYEFQTKAKESQVLFFNVSMKQLFNFDLVPKLTKWLKKYPLKTDHIYLELNEEILMNKEEKVFETIDRLHKLGFKWALDQTPIDFKMIDRMKELPLSIIKIDVNKIDDVLETKRFIDRLQESYDHLEIIGTQVVSSKQLEQLKALNIQYAEGDFIQAPQSMYDVLSE